ncbi:hypothetical protein D3C78_1931710 [compost metagenome]
MHQPLRRRLGQLPQGCALAGKQIDPQAVPGGKQLLDVPIQIVAFDGDQMLRGTANLVGLQFFCACGGNSLRRSEQVGP